MCQGQTSWHLAPPKQMFGSMTVMPSSVSGARQRGTGRRRAGSGSACSAGGCRDPFPGRRSAPGRPGCRASCKGSDGRSRPAAPTSLQWEPGGKHLRIGFITSPGLYFSFSSRQASTQASQPIHLERSCMVANSCPLEAWTEAGRGTPEAAAAPAAARALSGRIAGLNQLA
jgi:hypothetical protein